MGRPGGGGGLILTAYVRERLLPERKGACVYDLGEEGAYFRLTLGVFSEGLTFEL